MANEKRDPLEYVINRMVKAGRSNAPAANGYGQARKELLDGIAALVAALEEAQLQIMYLNDKFKPTGTSVAVLTKIRAALDLAKGEK